MKSVKTPIRTGTVTAITATKRLPSVMVASDFFRLWQEPSQLPVTLSLAELICIKLLTLLCKGGIITVQSINKPEIGESHD